MITPVIGNWDRFKQMLTQNLCPLCENRAAKSTHQHKVFTLPRLLLTYGWCKTEEEGWHQLNITHDDGHRTTDYALVSGDLNWEELERWMLARLGFANFDFTEREMALINEHGGYQDKDFDWGD